MKGILFSLFFLLLELNSFAQSETLLKLWYDKPAEQWVEALPVGNGRLGAMIYGNPLKEEIQLNENTIWAGQPSNNNNPAAKEALPKVRELIFQGKYKEAQDLVDAKFISRKTQGMPYQTAGSISLSFPGHDKFSNYYRELNIENAVATTIYTAEGVKYKRECFSSYPDQIIAIRISADKPGKINFSASLNHPLPVNICTKGNDELLLSGVSGDCDSIKGAVKFNSRIKIIAKGGTVASKENNLTVTNADEALILISIATSFNNFKDISGDAEKRAYDYLENASRKNYGNLLADHISDYGKYFNRVKINLGENDNVKYPTDIRIKQFAGCNDPQLAALYFQFGRYLLISSSRPGGQPANLQGIWNNQLMPPWDSKYTVNINAEMNYWPSETTNLSEMNEPLIKMVKELSEAGKETAKIMYGADGWVCHHNTDVWRICGPVDGSFWGMWPMGGAWLCQHLYDKYLFSGDKEYLKSVYDVMKSSVEFYLSFLIEEPNNKWLVVSPSVSPENAPSSHPEASISYGTTMDNQLLFDLFTKTKEASEILNVDSGFRIKLDEVIKRLPPMQIGKHSQLQEWIEDLDNPKDDHRHVSHLYGVFPSNQISPFTAPELFDAARTSLIYRGDPSTGWSMNWKINLWAHFLDGNHAYKLITDQISLVSSKDRKGGTYPNMFDAHPPFQIDGNFGFTSGIAEMLMQSDDDAIFVLPALPDVWQEGSIQGLRARGGFEITGLEWKDGKIVKLAIKSNLGGNCRIRSYNQLKTDDNKMLKQAAGNNSNAFFKIPEIKEPVISDKAEIKAVNIKTTFTYDVETEPGKVYTFIGL